MRIKIFLRVSSPKFKKSFQIHTNKNFVMLEVRTSDDVGTVPTLLVVFSIETTVDAWYLAC